MKLVVLDHPDWLPLKQANKVIPRFNTGMCALALHKHPATKHWRPALIVFTALVPIFVIAGIYLFFTKWWLGLILILFALFPLRKGIRLSIHQEILRVAEKDTSFFACAIATGGLRFWVKDEDLLGIQFMDGKTYLSLFMPKFD